MKTVRNTKEKPKKEADPQEGVLSVRSVISDMCLLLYLSS